MAQIHVCVVRHSPAWLPLYKAIFISVNPLGPQQTSAVRSLVIEALNTRFLYPEELPLNSRLHITLGLSDPW